MKFCVVKTKQGSPLRGTDRARNSKQVNQIVRRVETHLASRLRDEVKRGLLRQSDAFPTSVYRAPSQVQGVRARAIEQVSEKNELVIGGQWIVMSTELTVRSDICL